MNEKIQRGTEHGLLVNTFMSINLAEEFHSIVSFGGIPQDVIKVFRSVFFLRRPASDVVFKGDKH